MIALALWQAILLGLVLLAAATLLAVWWRQQSYQWLAVLAVGVVAAVALSWWSSLAFRVADYRAGCDGLCPGYRGAPFAIFRGAAAGNTFRLDGFLLDILTYFLLLLTWAAVVRAVLRLPNTQADTRRSLVAQLLLAAVLFILPLALAPWWLPPPEAHVRGDPQRISINGRREVYLYNQLARFPVLRVGLEDVRPRPDGQLGMRVCLTAYTFFYMPINHLYLDMTLEGVHSNHGGVLPLASSCWE